MELIPIDDSRIKIMLTPPDMRRYDLRAEPMDRVDNRTRRAFRHIFRDAREMSGFDTAGARLFVQLYTALGGGCEIFVTKLTRDTPCDDSLSAIDCSCLPASRKPSPDQCLRDIQASRDNEYAPDESPSHANESSPACRSPRDNEDALTERPTHSGAYPPAGKPGTDKQDPHVCRESHAPARTESEKMSPELALLARIHREETAMPSPKTTRPHAYITPRPLDRIAAYRFHDLDDLLALCRRLRSSKTAAYRESAAYIVPHGPNGHPAPVLILTIPDCPYDPTASILAEYADEIDDEDLLSLSIGEYGRILCEEDAVTVLARV